MYFMYFICFVITWQSLFSPVAALAGISLRVSSAAIGGIPSFPYGWCMENYYGLESDAISWEFTLNEARQSDLFEAFLRYSTSLPNSPMLLINDGRFDVSGVKRRRAVLDHYHGILSDSFFVDARGAYKQYAADKKDYEKADKTNWPPGFLDFFKVRVW